MNESEFAVLIRTKYLINFYLFFYSNTNKNIVLYKSFDSVIHRNLTLLTMIDSISIKLTQSGLL